MATIRKTPPRKGANRSSRNNKPKDQSEGANGDFSRPALGQTAIDEEIQKVGGMQAALDILRATQTRVFQGNTSTHSSAVNSGDTIKNENPDGMLVRDIRSIEALVAKQRPYLENIKNRLHSVGAFQGEGKIEDGPTKADEARSLSSLTLDIQERLRIHGLILEDLEKHADFLFRKK